MGYCVIRNNNKYIYNLVEIICDLESDVVSIPTTFSPGSKVFVVESSSYYMLNASNEWKKLVKTGEGVNGSIEELKNKIKTLSTNVLYKPDSKNLN